MNQSKEGGKERVNFAIRCRRNRNPITLGKSIGFAAKFFNLKQFRQNHHFRMVGNSINIFH